MTPPQDQSPDQSQGPGAARTVPGQTTRRRMPPLFTDLEREILTQLHAVHAVHVHQGWAPRLRTDQWRALCVQAAEEIGASIGQAQEIDRVLVHNWYVDHPLKALRARLSGRYQIADLITLMQDAMDLHDPVKQKERFITRGSQW